MPDFVHETVNTPTAMSTIISIVSYPFLPAKLGGQKGIALFYKYFAKHYRLICVTTQNNDPTAAEDYQVINSISPTPLRYINIFLFLSFYNLIRKEKASHLLLEHPYYGWLGILLKWTTAAKLIVHCHNIEAVRWRTLGKWWWPVLAAYEKFTLRSADYIFFKTAQDKLMGTATYRLNNKKATVITYGIEWDAAPTAAERQQCRQQLQQLHHIQPGESIFLFNGSLNYMPNLDAVKTILEKINPALLPSALAYKIIICGKGLPASMNDLINYAGQNIIYAGFVDDISIYFKGADTFINPVVDGGGIKTKLVEALGYNMQVITTVSGAIGVPLEVTGHKMKVVKDNDWTDFAQSMMETNSPSDIPAGFFDYFYWENIAKKADDFIRG